MPSLPMSPSNTELQGLVAGSISGTCVKPAQGSGAGFLMLLASDGSFAQPTRMTFLSLGEQHLSIAK